MVMKTSRENATHAITLIETIVVVAVMALLAILILPTLRRARTHSGISCINNLKQIGLAFKEWSLDNDGKYPMQVCVADGGARELIATGDVASVFRVMSNECSTPKVLICPADKKRLAAANFENALSDSSISYFVGIDATTSTPAMFLSGDRNITNGLSLKRGILDLTTNKMAGWTTEIHTLPARKFFGFDIGKIGWGNVGFADGSANRGGSRELSEWLQDSGAATNLLAIP